MVLSLQLRPYHPSVHGNEFDTLLAVVKACEQAGLDSAWMADHVMFADPMNPDDTGLPVVEAFVTLGALAITTSRIRLGQLLTGVPYRNSALLAQMCAKLNVASHIAVRG